MALATHSQFLIAAYVIDTEHEKNEFFHWLAQTGSAYWDQ
jgi:hypothetical protein